MPPRPTMVMPDTHLDTSPEAVEANIMAYIDKRLADKKALEDRFAAADANTEHAPLWNQMGASLKRTPEGEENYISATVGTPERHPTTGELYYTPTGDTNLRKWNKTGLDMGDVAGAAPDILRGLGSAGGGALGGLMAAPTGPGTIAGMAAGSAAGGALGDAIAQTLGKAAPGNEAAEYDTSARAKDILTTGAIEGAGSFIAPGFGLAVKGAAKAAKGTMRGVDKVLKFTGDYAVDGSSGRMRALAQETEIPFTPAQMAEKKATLAAEDQLRNSFGGGKVIGAADDAAAAGLHDYAVKTSKQLGGSPRIGERKVGFSLDDVVAASTRKGSRHADPQLLHQNLSKLPEGSVGPEAKQGLANLRDAAKVLSDANIKAGRSANEQNRQIERVLRLGLDYGSMGGYPLMRMFRDNRMAKYMTNPDTANAMAEVYKAAAAKSPSKVVKTAAVQSAIATLVAHYQLEESSEK